MAILNKLFVMLVVIANFILSPVSSCHASENLALGKLYTFSQMPNYPLTAPPSDTTSLTDGKFSIGNFWTQRSTVGWQGTKTVEILIDLGKESHIASITFNTARGENAGVYYPAHIAAFVGSDPDHLLYVGDLADVPENQPGTYKLKRFVQNIIGVPGRFIFLVAISKGNFLFCDEIEVLEGVSAKRERGSLSLDQAREFTNQIRRVEIEKPLLSRLADDLHKMPVSSNIDNQLQNIMMKIASLKSGKESMAVETELLSLRRASLASKLPDTPLLIQSIDQWAPLNPMSPIPGSAPSLTFTMPWGGYDAGAVAITNLSAGPREISFLLESASKGVSIVLYSAPFIKSAAMEYVADPLVPVAVPIILRPGESRMIFITVFGKQPGKSNATLRIKSDGKVMSVPVASHVVNVKLPNHLLLNTVNWGYLDFKLIRNRNRAAVDDLLAHHTKVIVVPPAYLPVSDSVKSENFNDLKKYLNISKRAAKVLLFASFESTKRSSANGKYLFMGNEWKTWFKTWYEELTKTAVNAGISKDSLYFYPYDEMAGKNIDNFINFAAWARKELPDIRLYATINNKNALKALSYLDVAQIANNEDLLKATGKTNTELWLYDAKGPAKSLSPYSYYRLMAWKAFAGDYMGIGFWSYSDAGWGDEPGTAWDDFDGVYPDYAVIYEGPNNTIISSRRWEAWRMGIEDYELLTMYAKVKGDSVAKSLVKRVLGHPQDTLKADEVRKKILLELE